MKVCNLCREEKELDEFYKSKASKDGRCRRCRACQRRVNKAHYAANKEARLAQIKEYASSHKDERNARTRKRRATDPVYREGERARGMVKCILSDRGLAKEGRTFELLGYTLEQYNAHIQSHLTEEMDWNDRSSYQVDHQLCQSAFLITSETDESFRICNSLANLLPMDPSENASKGDSIDPELIASLSLPLKPEHLRPWARQILFP